MADYFPLLSRTIASLGNSTAEQRQAVYQRARVVVEDQLSAIDPPMAEEAISKELELFEQSVIRLEQEMLSLESMKSDPDGGASKEHTTRRHISARLSDLMAKAAAARTAATQERLKSELPPVADPALAGPAVRVESVPSPFTAEAEAESYADHADQGVDHPFIRSPMIEGDPLDALAEAHRRKVAQQPPAREEAVVSAASVQEAAREAQGDPVGPAAASESLERSTLPLPDPLPPPNPYDPLPPKAPELISISSHANQLELASGLLAHSGTGELRGRAAPVSADNFSLIPWLSADFIGSAQPDAPDESDAPSQDPVVEPPHEEAAATEPRPPAPLTSAHTDEQEDQDHATDPTDALPEMPQAVSAGAAHATLSSPPWQEWGVEAPPSPGQDTQEPAPESAEAPSFPFTPSLQEMDTAAAKAAFWGQAHLSKQEEPVPADHPPADATLQSADLESAETVSPAALLELTEDESRPRLLQKRRLDRDVVRKLVMVAVFASVTAAVGVTAWILRDQPSDFEQSASAQRTDLSRKINDRLPSDQATQSQAQLPASQTRQVVGQRAILLEEIPEGQAAPPPVTGQVSWSLETIRDSTGAADVAVKADVKGLSGSLSSMTLGLKRNRDTSFPASHLLEVNFVTPDTSPNGAVRDIGLPELRVDETTRGAALFGLPVPVTDNVFLVGLTNLPDRIEFNIDLLRSRKWIVVPIRFGNGRRAALMIEKGLAGDRALLDAFQAWK